MDTSHRIDPARRSTIAAVGLVTLAVALTACGGAIGPGSESDTDASFDGEWRFVDGSTADGPIAVPQDGDVTLTIDGASVGGRSHCNSYNGTASIDGDSIEVDGVAVTEMACLDEALMEAEAAYLDAFLGSTDISLDDDRLLLRGDASELAYERLEPEEPAAFEGTTWLLDGLVRGTGDDASVSSIPEPADEEGRRGSLTFDGEQLGGFDLCNTFGGSYELEGDPREGARLQVGELTGDGAGCDSAVEPANEHLLQVLRADDVQLRVEGRTMTLTAGELGLIYRAED
jgi:heat shock protein HslJ